MKKPNPRRVIKNTKIKHKKRKPKIMYKCVLKQERQQRYYRDVKNEHGAYDQGEELVTLYELQFNFNFAVHGTLKEDQTLPNIIVSNVVVLTINKEIADKFTIGGSYASSDLPLKE